MFRIGTGWLGWSEDQTLDADMNNILLAYEGKIDMLKACYGSEDKTKGKPGRKISPKELRSFAATHNAVIKGS